MMTIEGTTYGVSDHAMAEMAHTRAVQEAIAISALASAVHPSGNEPFLRLAAEQLMDKIVAFALHARRDVEIRDAGGIIISDQRWDVGGIEVETDFWTVINKILHARDIKVVSWPMGNSVFGELGDRVFSHIQVRSDRGDSIYFCPMGLVYAYLSTQRL